MHALLIIASLVALAAPAPEQLREAERLAQKAVTAFRADRFEQAGEDFLRAYALSGEPTQLRNAAKAYDAAGLSDKAQIYWRTLAKLPAASEEDRREAAAHLRVEEKRPVQHAAPAPQLVTQPVPKSNPVPWIIGATGALAVTTGAVMFAIAAGDQSSLQLKLDQRSFGKITGIAYEDAIEERDHVAHLRTAGAIALSAGVAALGTSVVLLLSGGEEDAPNVAVVPLEHGAIAAYGVSW